MNMKMLKEIESTYDTNEELYPYHRVDVIYKSLFVIVIEPW